MLICPYIQAKSADHEILAIVSIRSDRDTRVLEAISQPEREGGSASNQNKRCFRECDR